MRQARHGAGENPSAALVSPTRSLRRPYFCIYSFLYPPRRHRWFGLDCPAYPTSYRTQSRTDRRYRRRSRRDGRLRESVPAYVRERRHLRPGCAIVVAFPKSVAAASAKIQNAVLIRIDHQTLAIATARHVASDLERERSRLPGISPVGRPHDGAGLVVPAVRVQAGCQIHPIGIDRVGCQRIHTVFVRIVPTNHIGNRDPAVVRLVPTVCAADIGTRINKIPLCLVEHDAVDIAASGTCIDAVERVRFACYGSMNLLRAWKPGTARNMTVNASRVMCLSLLLLI